MAMPLPSSCHLLFVEAHEVIQREAQADAQQLHLDGRATVLSRCGNVRPRAHPTVVTVNQR